MGELASRSISFLLDRYLKHTAAPTKEESLRSLQRLLLRVRVVVEEADDRLITNQAMLHQLSILKKEMYRGYYTLDIFSCRASGDARTKDHEVSYSFAPSKFNPAKSVYFCSEGAAQAGKVGKSTLVVHACDDERVRNHFSQILFFNEGDLKDASVETLRDGGRIKHQNRTLVIIELLLDIDESEWKRLHSAVTSCLANGSKIIIVSRFDRIASFGTTQPLRLQFLTQEAYWYFFKVRTFGSTAAEDHPKLASMAMDIARLMNGCFVSAAVFSGLLKGNFYPHLWSMALATLRNSRQKNISVYGEGFTYPWQMLEPCYVRITKKTSSECFVISVDCQPCSAETKPEDPGMISVKDLLFGCMTPRGKFKVHAMTSHLPPHYIYMFDYIEIQEARV